MINWNTIISTFNAKGTLLKWLKNLTKQLDKGSLESIDKVSVAGNKYKLRFNFGDESFIDSPDLSEGGGGTSKEITNIDLTSPVSDVTYDTTDGIQITGTGKVTYGDTTYDSIESTFNVPIVPVSGELVIDENEDEQILIGIDQDITSKVDRALLVPVSTPTENELVGINTSKSQTRITIGNGLQLVNNELSATTGSVAYPEQAVNKKDTGELDVTMNPNVNYRCLDSVGGDGVYLAILRLESAESEKLSEYRLTFKTAASVNASTISIVPGSGWTVKWFNEPTIEANTIYEISIVRSVIGGTSYCLANYNEVGA